MDTKKHEKQIDLLVRLWIKFCNRGGVSPMQGMWYETRSAVLEWCAETDPDFSAGAFNTEVADRVQAAVYGKDG